MKNTHNFRFVIAFTTLCVPIITYCTQSKYRISSISFRGNYSFFGFGSSQYIRPKVKVHKFVETIQGRKLFKGEKLYEEIYSTFFRYELHILEFF